MVWGSCIAAYLWHYASLVDANSNDAPSFAQETIVLKRTQAQVKALGNVDITESLKSARKEYKNRKQYVESKEHPKYRQNLKML